MSQLKTYSAEVPEGLELVPFTDIVVELLDLGFNKEERSFEGGGHAGAFEVRSDSGPADPVV